MLVEEKCKELHQYLSLNKNISITQENDKLIITYPTVFEHGNYFNNKIILEFGGRNVIVPNQKMLIVSDIENIPHFELTLPKANAVVLDYKRTFVEKLAAIQAECTRQDLKQPQRFFRHYYDVVKINEVLKQNKEEIEQDLIDDVLATKRAFYHNSWFDYDSFKKREFVLLNDDFTHLLKTDFEQMVASNMFYQPVNFDEIMQNIKIIENNNKNVRRP